ncbi:unnamed protein product, partial [Prunus brigantina]
MGKPLRCFCFYNGHATIFNISERTYAEIYANISFKIRGGWKVE